MAFILPIICNAGDGFICFTEAAAGRARIGTAPKARPPATAPGEVFLNIAQMPDDGLPDVRMVHLGKFKHQGRGDVRLFMDRLTEVELASLTVMISEALCAGRAP